MGNILGLFLLIVFSLPALAVEQADLWMEEGLKILKEKPESLVQAAGLFAKAADAYEAKGNDAKATEANSCLYWTRKKFTVRDTGIIVQGNPIAAKRMEKLVAEKPKEEDAQGYLDRADTFAKDSKDPLLTAIRYFEVADRFPSTDQGRKAMDASLKAMSKVSAKKEPEKKLAVAGSAATAILGKWEISYANKGGTGTQIVLFERDGVAKVTTSSVGPFKGTWKVEGDEVVFTTPYSVSRLKVRGEEFEGKSSDGGTRNGKRIQE